MIITRIYTIVILGGSFQQATSESKIVVRQTDAENNELESLKAFARRGDPCIRLQRSLQSSEPSKADEDCVRAVKGYAQLPRKVRKRCGDPVIESSGCKVSKSPVAMWQCGWLHSEDERRVVSLSYCIENLDLGCYFKKWLKRSLQPQSTKPRQRVKSIVVQPQLEEKETYLKRLKMFTGINRTPERGSNDSVLAAVAGSHSDPCARLKPIPKADAILKADRLCKAVIDDFKSLPIEAKDLCQNEAMQNEGCKREPHPSKKWCCGLHLRVKRIGFGSCFLPKKTGTICFSYCMRDLEIRILS